MLIKADAKKSPRLNALPTDENPSQMIKVEEGEEAAGLGHTGQHQPKGDELSSKTSKAASGGTPSAAGQAQAQPVQSSPKAQRADEPGSEDDDYGSEY